MIDCYEVLGLEWAASLDDAERAYHDLVRQFHPDRFHGADPDELEQAEERTRELNDAIATLRSVGMYGRNRPPRQEPRASYSARRTEPPPDPDEWPQTDDQPFVAEEPEPPWDREHEWIWEPAPPSSEPVTCPFCSEEMTDLVGFFAHLDARHPRHARRGERRARRIRKRMAKVDHSKREHDISPALISFVVTGLVAAVVTVLLCRAFGYWPL